MTQSRMTTVLLFVCLSLVFKVAQSGLKCMDSTCKTSDECDSKCCYRDSPTGTGKCIPLSSNSCFGRKDGERCFYNNDCNSECCHPVINEGPIAICILKSTEHVKCFGSENGAFCYSSDECKSGCCYRRNSFLTAGECALKEKTRKCFGSNIGQYCSLSNMCESGCCRRRNTFSYDNTICLPRARQNEYCSVLKYSHIYSFCPCESGFICAENGKDLRICKKRKTEN